jgi:hypothetical protein
MGKEKGRENCKSWGGEKVQKSQGGKGETGSL